MSNINSLVILVSFCKLSNEIIYIEYLEEIGLREKKARNIEY